MHLVHDAAQARVSAGRLGLVAGVALLVVVGALVLIGRGGGGGGEASADGAVRLEWDGKTTLVKVPELPRDRILAGKVRNVSLKPVKVAVNRIQVVDANGRPLKHSARFLSAFAHGLYPPSQKFAEPGKFERTRLGEIATIKPGQSIPLTLSWRMASEKGPAPAEVRFGGGSLPLGAGV